MNIVPLLKDGGIHLNEKNEKWVLRAIQPDTKNELFYTGRQRITADGRAAIVGNIQSARLYATYGRAEASVRLMAFDNYKFEVKRQSDFIKK